MNFVRGRLRAAASNGGCEFESGELTLRLPRYQSDASGEVVIGIRPQQLSLTPALAPTEDHTGAATLSGNVWLVEALGSEQIIHVTAGELRDLLVVAPPEVQFQVGDAVHALVRPDAVHVFDASTGRRLTPLP
jgi:ABC-type sugar transport system ATPase subunit